jgi:hypothetical protein
VSARCGPTIFDAMIAASALHADCDTLWSEDMQHGMTLENRLRIANPFRGAGRGDEGRKTDGRPFAVMSPRWAEISG